MNGYPADEAHSVRGDYAFKPFPGGESYADVVRRVRSILNDLLGAPTDGTVLVIAHRAPHHALEHLLNGHDLAELVAQNGDGSPVGNTSSATVSRIRQAGRRRGARRRSPTSASRSPA
jgi:broad specificity phosphatase PhoE